MKVLYDDRCFRLKFGGVPRYFAEVIKRLPRDVEWQIAAEAVENTYLQQPPFRFRPAQEALGGRWFADRFLGGHYIRGLDRALVALQWMFPRAMRADKFINDRLFKKMAGAEDVDIVHLTEPHYYNYGWKSACKGKKVVVTVHDLIPDMVWNYAWMRPYRKKVLERADAIIAVSKYTRDRIVEFYGISPEKITVIYHGYLDYADQADGTLFCVKRYILYVGNRNSYKNFPFFIKAVAPLVRGQEDLFLVCTGPDFDKEERELIAGQGICDKVLHRFVEDGQMRSLYANAEAFVYPSLVEGFGLPILDAFAAKCPVVLSNCSCFPEIANDAALYFEKDDADGMRNALNALMSDRELRNAMVARGTERLKSFSWQKCCDETVGVYKKVVS